METQFGRETYALYKAGAMDEWSIGFDPLIYEHVRRGDVDCRLLKELRLWEYSPVTWGMNQATITTAVKNDSRPASPDAGTSPDRLEGEPVRAEPQKAALTQAMLKAKALEISLGLIQPRE